MRLPILLLLGCALGACDRVPIELPDATLTAESPNLGEVQLDPSVSLRLVPDNARGTVTLAVRGEPVAFDPADGAFTYDVTLDQGLNTFPFTLTDEDGEARADTFYAVHLPLARTTEAEGATARVGAASSPSGESRLVSGGLGDDRGPLATASQVTLADDVISETEISLRTPRAFHTATALDGGVLLVGGAVRDLALDPTDFVTEVEWVRDDGTIASVAVDTEIRRSGHGARLLTHDGQAVLYLMGGRTPRSAASATADVFQVLREPDGTPRLERLSPDSGVSGFATIAGLAFQTVGERRALGFGVASGEGVAVRSVWFLPGTPYYPFSLRTVEVPPLTTPRIDAATADLGGGLVLVVGGRDAVGTPLGSMEVYADAPGLAFRVPESVRLAVPRSGATATIFDGRRIVVSGGRPASGSATARYEVFRY